MVEQWVSDQILEMNLDINKDHTFQVFFDSGYKIAVDKPIQNNCVAFVQTYKSEDLSYACVRLTEEIVGIV
jgi:hypothetical protein